MSGDEPYAIEGPKALPPPLEGHIKLGTAVSPSGTRYGANSRYFTRDGKPWYPVMGEIHYSRYPREDWDEAVRLMKAGGIQVVSCYVFWNHHEEERGVFEWNGNKDIRAFVETCGRHGLTVWLRAGPWCHGEARNGGFPDWVEKTGRGRTNDPGYLADAKRWYGAVAGQVGGLWHKDGGPIIGMQLENEFGHCGPKGEDGYEHILNLKKMAVECGMDPVYWTVTGWGRAWVPQDEVLPVFGAYPDAPWEEGFRRLEPTYSHAFSGLWEQIAKTTIGSDSAKEVAKEASLTFDPTRTPFATAEVGAGNEPRYWRRPVFPGVDGITVPFVKIGEGANLMGYYMYHGGSNPPGKLTTLEEPGYAVISYDFQAPLGEFGKCSSAWAGLRQLHSFLADFGDLVATTVPVLGVPTAVPADPKPLRVALRSDGERGFLVINNHQRYVKMPERRVRFAVKLGGGTVTFPDEPAVMAPSVTAIWPVNMPLLDAVVTWATAQPLMKLSCDGVPRFVFAATPGVAPELMLSGVTSTRASAGSALPAAGGHRVRPLPGAPVEVETAGGAKAELLVLPAEDALTASKVKMAGGERMALCPAEGWQDGGTLTVRARGGGKVPLSIYPAYSGELSVGGRAVKPEVKGAFSAYDLDFGEVPQAGIAVEPGAVRPEADTRYRFREVYKVPGDRYEAWRLAVDPGAWKGASDLVLCIGCVADTMRLYLGGRLVADQLWKNVTWEVGLKRWRRELEGGADLVLVISPWQKNAEVFLDERPAVTADATARLDGVWVAVERKVMVALP